MSSIEETTFDKEFPPQISMESYRWEYPYEKTSYRVFVIPSDSKDYFIMGKHKISKSSSRDIFQKPKK